MNWVEKRWTIEQNLIKGAPEVWQAVVTAIDNACQTLKQHYSDVSDITCKPQNGHRVLVSVNRKQIPAHLSVYDERIDIQIIYERAESRIAVIVGYNKTPKHFPSRSDETHAFLIHDINARAEISPDDFSQLVLQDAFFTVRETKSSQSHSGGPSSWMS